MKWEAGEKKALEWKTERQKAGNNCRENESDMVDRVKNEVLGGEERDSIG